MKHRAAGTWAGIDEFYAVAQERSFTAAARKLGLSTSQVSREVGRLEIRLGQRLLYRSTRHVSLTEVGERFLARCQRLLEERDEALAATVDESARLQGLLRVTCSERFVVPMINRFLLGHPGLNADVLLANGPIDLIREGLDMAIRFGEQRDSRLVASRLGARTRYLCAAPSYLKAHGTPQSVKDLARHASVCGRDDAWSFSVSGRLLEFRPVARFRCNSGYAVVDAAVSGLGLCQLPDFYVEAPLRSSLLKELLPRARPPDEDVWAVYPHRRQVPAKVRLAVEHLQQEFLKRLHVTDAAELLRQGR